MKVVVLFSLTLFAVFSAASEHCATYSDSKGQRILTEERVQKDSGALVDDQGISDTTFPRFFIEHSAPSNDRLIRLCGKSQAVVHSELARRGVRRHRPALWEAANDEVFTLIENGPSKNRINLVFLGDGYTKNEKDKFLADMKRLNRNIFEDKTFRSYLPIFNVYAVFRPSTETGLGKGTPKNTAYGLYREGNTLRAIFISKPAAAHDACSNAPGCDFPIVIANDPYYGGLGGEFSISTSSSTSGHVVLRHELGHSVGRIGEEYDGGGYFGANHSSSLSNISWSHWLSGDAVAEPVVARKIDWPWVNLSTSAFTTNLSSDGKWGSVELNFSVSGAETDEDILISLDGKQIPFKSPGHSDRDFHSLKLTTGLTSGSHSLKFEEGVEDGNNWLSSLTLHEFGSKYHFERDYIGAFPVFTKLDAVDGYRPTHGTCLMREMKSEDFCSVCQENNWLMFFERIDLIDQVTVVKEGTNYTATVETQKLGQFRKTPGLETEKINIRWLRNGNEVAEFENLEAVEIPAAQAKDAWEVAVKLITPEVRKDPKGWLNSKKEVGFPTL